MDALTWLRAQWDRAFAWFLIGFGGLIVGAGALGARKGLYTADQFSFLMSGGVAGLGSAALGGVLLVSSGLHDRWRKLHAVEAALRDRESLIGSVSLRGSAADVTGNPRRASVHPARWLRAEFDRATGWALVGVAAVLLIVGGRDVADALYGPAQVAYLISGGLTGLLLVVAAGGFFLFADLRDEESKLMRVELAARGTPRPEARAIWAAGATGDAASPNRLGPPNAPVRVVDRAWVVVLAASLLIGAALIGAGWWQAAEAVGLGSALDGLVLATAGLVVPSAAWALVALGLRRRLARRAADVLSQVRSLVTSCDVGEVTFDLTLFRTAVGLKRYHRSWCPALAGAAGEHFVADPAQKRLEPCLLCADPDDMTLEVSK